MESYEKYRQAVFDHYGRVCRCCGETSNLGIDHVNGDGLLHRDEIGPGSYELYRWLVNADFPSNFQTLCNPCNSSKKRGSACLLHNPHIRREHHATRMKYVNVRVSPEASQALRVLAAIATGQAMRRVTKSCALIAAVKVARNHPDEFAAAFSEDGI